MADVIVVGGGVGGLCAAIRLGARGHRVTLLERNDELGGKLTARVREGYTFDTGPSLLTLPAVFDEVLALAGTSLAAEVALERLDPQFAYHWPDRSSLVVPDGLEAAEARVEAFSPGHGAPWRAFVERGGRIWDVAERTFFAGPMERPGELLGRMRSPLDLARIDPFRTLAGAAGRAFRDPRLVQWAGRYATYSGSSPYLAPATLACIPAIEARYGAWYVQGGLGALRDALVRAAGAVGVELRTGEAVARVEAGTDRVHGVHLAGGERLAAHVVVANVDAEELYAHLLADAGALRRVRRAERSTSGFVVLAGVEGPTSGIAHHTVWFSGDYEAEFQALVRDRVPAPDPTVYACVSSVTDPTQAPPEHENWFLLVNAPVGGTVRWDARAESYRDLVLERLAARGTDLSGRLRFTEVITPDDIAARYRTPGGSIYGTSSNGRRAAFLRPANRGPRAGLYLVGGSSHPGGGLPLVATSARIVAGMVQEDGW